MNQTGIEGGSGESQAGSERARVASSAFLDRLRSIVGAENCLAREGELFAYECDGLTLEPRRPLAVVLPETTEEVAGIVRACNEHDIHFVPRGAGTGLSGGATASEGAVHFEDAYEVYGTDEGVAYRWVIR